MREEGTMAAPLGAGWSLLAMGMLLVAAVGAPTADRAQFDPVAQSWQWNPPQRHAWNPYDCRFWQDLPPVEFGPD